VVQPPLEGEEAREDLANPRGAAADEERSERESEDGHDNDAELYQTVHLEFYESSKW